MNTNQTSGPLFNWTQAIYALHAFSLLVGIFGAATVVGAFLIGWPSIIAVILNYVKRAEVRGFDSLDGYRRADVRVSVPTGSTLSRDPPRGRRDRPSSGCNAARLR